MYVVQCTKHHYNNIGIVGTMLENVSITMPQVGNRGYQLVYCGSLNQKTVN